MLLSQLATSTGQHWHLRCRQLPNCLNACSNDMLLMLLLSHLFDVPLSPPLEERERVHSWRHLPFLTTPDNSPLAKFCQTFKHLILAFTGALSLTDVLFSLFCSYTVHFIWFQQDLPKQQQRLQRRWQKTAVHSLALPNRSCIVLRRNLFCSLLLIRLQHRKAKPSQAKSGESMQQHLAAERLISEFISLAGWWRD